VKARTTDAFGLPAEALVPSKQARLRRLAARWLAAARSAAGARDGPDAGQLGSWPVRFDVVCVLAGRLEVIEGAF
jgi:Holliday junction resolvase-like predicted endonuclease